jgi:hypothetical protein
MPLGYVGGFCEETTEPKTGSFCKAGHRKGAISLPKKTFNKGWAHASLACMRECSLCRRAAFFTVSLHYNDCSWYDSCPGEVAGASPPILPNNGNASWFRTFEISSARQASKAQFAAAERLDKAGEARAARPILERALVHAGSRSNTQALDAAASGKLRVLRHWHLRWLHRAPAVLLSATTGLRRRLLLAKERHSLSPRTVSGHAEQCDARGVQCWPARRQHFLLC